MSNETVSYSRLGTFLDCPELYRLRYIKRDKSTVPNFPLEEPLIKGNLAHACIEEYLRGGDKQTAIEVALAQWLVEICNLPLDKRGNSSKPTAIVEEAGSIYDEWVVDEQDNITYEDAKGEGIDLELLTDYALSCGHLLHRASGCYNKEDKIRNRDGSVPKNPLDYPPSTFSNEYRSQNLDVKRLALDTQAAQCNISFKRMSLANIAAQGVCYAFNFEVPDLIDDITAIEYALADKPVYFGGQKELYWNGYIDTIYETADGAVVINDHKTERERRRPEDVAFDLQLNSYAAVIYEQTGKVPDYVSITHLATNSFIVSQTDLAVMADSMEYLEEIQSEIDAMRQRRGDDQEWFKKHPTKYGSPCLRRRNDVLEKVCPFIRKCWPTYSSCIEDELNDFLGW